MVMATNTSKSPAGMKRNTGALVMHTLGRQTKPLRAFWLKFNNDWSWNNAAGLAYNLLLSMFPLVIAFLAIVGLLLGRLDPAGYDKVIERITYIFPAATSSPSIIKLALHQLTKNSGILGIFAIVVAIFYGSGLFVFMDGCFYIILLVIMLARSAIVTVISADS